MRLKVPVIIFTAALALGFCSCNSESVENVVLTDLGASSVEIKAFSVTSTFGAKDEDSLSFSVNLEAGLIFNADSLPVGTELKKALVSLDLPSVSKAEIVMHYEDAAKEDVIVDYLSSPSDSIDFAADKVSVRIVSTNQTVRREYSVKVNVHKIKPDSLYWDENPYSTIPGAETGAKSSRTVKMGEKYFTLTELTSGMMLATGNNIAESASWQNVVANVPAGAVVGSFSATDDALFILDDTDKLFTSSDGQTWNETGESMSHIYGGYGKTLLGVKNDGGKYYHVTYPATVETEIENGCPISGTSTLAIYDTEWSINAMALFTGGKDAEGNLSGATWGYDGSVWAKLSIEPIPALEGVSVCQYYSVSSTLFKTTTTPMLYAFGGRDKNGSVNSKVYVSIDRGVHWREGDVNIQLSPSVPKLAGAQVFVEDRTMYVSSETDTQSRAIKPITSWECPYLYLVGGNYASGKFNNGIYRGVINFLAFIPIQ
ncbi:MAG: hypothetical protein K2K52_03630 [Paramuribaculum sp.]|nr:hypothetical protein [Paramuribaculum sp.]